MVSNDTSEHPDVVAIGSSPVLIGRDSQADVRIDDRSVSGRHAVVRREGDGLIVEDLQSKFGTQVNGQPIKLCRLRRGDRLQFGTATFFRVDDFTLHRETSGGGIAIRGDDLELRRDSRTTVRRCSFVIHPNEFVGILGPSGSGKSTLLNCLAAFLSPTSGSLQFDDGRNAFIEIEEYRSDLGYVPQHDQFHEGLSVDEILRFADELRSSRPTDARAEVKITETLNWLGMEAHRSKAHLSGGQRKRVGIATELIARPRLLLLDEPTSPLDPAGEANLMNRLRHIARRGTTVVCTTHKVDNIRMFDRLIVLGVRRDDNGSAVGEIAFVGRPDEILAHFGCTDFADVYERLENGDFPQPNRNPSSDPPADPTVRRARIRGNTTAEQVPAIWRRLTAAATDQINQFQVARLFDRSWRLLTRDRGLMRMLIAQPVLLGGLVCLTQFKLSRSGAILFFASIIAVWLGLNNSVREVVRERAVFVREQLAGLRLGPFLASKAAYFSLLGIVQMLILVMTLAFGGLFLFTDDTASEFSPTNLVRHFAVLFLAYQGGLALGLTVSIIARTESQAVAVLPFLVMPQLLISWIAVGTHGPHDTKGPFRPLAATWFSEAPPPNTPANDDKQAQLRRESLVNTASMICFSRPASILLEGRTASGHSRWGLWLDALHLSLLVTICWVACWSALRRCSPSWPKLVGFA